MKLNKIILKLNFSLVLFRKFFQFRAPLNFGSTRAHIIEVLDSALAKRRLGKYLNSQEKRYITLFNIFNPINGKNMLHAFELIQNAKEDISRLPDTINTIERLCLNQNKEFLVFVKYAANYCLVFEVAIILRRILLDKYSWRFGIRDYFSKSPRKKQFWRCKLRFTSWIELLELEQQLIGSPLEAKTNIGGFMPEPALSFQKEHEKSLRIYVSPFSESNPKLDGSYGDYIYRKSIAIVGPSLRLGNYGSEIDSTDIVVRLNYNGNLIHDSSKGGSKTNISYFNGTKASFFKGVSSQNISSEIQWVILKDFEYSNAFLGFAKNIRTTRMSISPYFAHFNLLPALLIDILSFQPGTVKIFGFDLYLSTSYPVGSLSANLLAKYPHLIDRYKTYPKASMSHEPIVQYLFLSRLLRENTIMADKVLYEILCSGLLSYLSELKCLYSSRAKS